MRKSLAGALHAVVGSVSGYGSGSGWNVWWAERVQPPQQSVQWEVVLGGEPAAALQNTVLWGVVPQAASTRQSCSCSCVGSSVSLGLLWVSFGTASLAPQGAKGCPARPQVPDVKTSTTSHLRERAAGVRKGKRLREKMQRGFRVTLDGWRGVIQKRSLGVRWGHLFFDEHVPYADELPAYDQNSCCRSSYCELLIAVGAVVEPHSPVFPFFITMLWQSSSRRGDQVTQSSVSGVLQSLMLLLPIMELIAKTIPSSACSVWATNPVWIQGWHAALGAEEVESSLSSLIFTFWDYLQNPASPGISIQVNWCLCSLAVLAACSYCGEIFLSSKVLCWNVNRVPPGFVFSI